MIYKNWKPLLLLLFAFHQMSFAQQYVFSHYSVNNGLSQSVIKCIFQDSKGYIWFGTQQGLNKFNGYNFENYLNSPADSNSISDNWIYSITEDNEGDIWIGTRNGLNKYIQKTGLFKQYLYNANDTNSISSNYIYGLSLDAQGNILANTASALNIINPGSLAIKKFVKPKVIIDEISDEGRPILQTNDGNIWIATVEGLWRFDSITKQFQVFDSLSRPNSLSNNNITALTEDSQGNLWIGSQNGLNRMNLESFAVSKYYLDSKTKESLNTNFIRSIREDRDRKIWAGTNGGGLFRLSLDSDFKILKQNNFVNAGQNAGNLSHNIVLSLFIDKTDLLWIGTLNGIDKTDLKKSKFNLYRKSDDFNSVGLLDNVIASVYKDKQNKIWIGNWGNGLNIFDRTANKVEHYTSQSKGNSYISNNFIHVIYEDSKNRIWIGTRDKINMFDRANKRFLPISKYFNSNKLPDFQNIRVNDIFEDSFGLFWIATQNGLYKLNIENQSVEIFLQGEGKNNVSSNLVYRIIEDSSQNLWIGTTRGLDKYVRKKNYFAHYQRNQNSSNTLCSNFIVSLCEDSEHNIWIGTTSGLNKFIPGDSVFVYFSKNNGLPSNVIYEIQEDKNKNLWFSTVEGLCVYYSKQDVFRTFEIADGMQGKEFNTASFKAGDGELFFGGMHGVNYFYPDSVKDNNYIPRVVITNIDKLSSRGIQHLTPESFENLRLSYQDYTFTIEFAALDYTNPLKNRFAYKMEGVADEWIDLGNRRNISFSNLPAGEYVFHVKGSNSDGIWNENATNMKIVIVPPVWKSKWAVMIYIMLAIFLIFVYIRNRERILLLEQKKLEEKVAARTREIALQKEKIEDTFRLIKQQNIQLLESNATKDKLFSIIAHDLKNPFAVILSLSETLSDTFSALDEDELEEGLKKMHSSAQKIYELLANLLTWSRSQTGNIQFNPEKLKLGLLVREVTDLLRNQYELKNIKLNVEIDPGLVIEADNNMLNTVMRNLISNSIKYTGNGGIINVSGSERDGNTEIVIKDNGVGIHKEIIDKLFKIEHKVSSPGTNNERGTGIGLILCKEFVEKHGGQIWLTSEIGKGSAFYFTIPNSK